MNRNASWDERQDVSRPDALLVAFVVGLALIVAAGAWWFHGQRENATHVTALAVQACGADSATVRKLYVTFQNRQTSASPGPGDSRLTVVACDGRRMIARPVVVRRAGSDIASDHARTDRIRVRLCGQVSRSKRLYHEHDFGKGQGEDYFWLLACGAATRLTSVEANY